MNQQDIDTIKKTVEEFFQEFAFEVEIEILPEKEGNVPVNIKTDEPKVLIGEGGQTLAEIQHLLKSILRKKISEPFYLSLDINSYKQKKYEYLRELARSIADEVSLSKEKKELAPMPAHERRIIHLELAERQDVATDSLGQEPERRVVIIPKL